MKATTPAISTTETERNETPSAAPVKIGTRRLSLVADAEVETRSGRLIWEPVEREPGAVPITSEVLSSMQPPEQLAREMEAAIIATLTRALRPDESHQIGNDNREREVRAHFASLTRIEAYHLGRRLDLDRDNDALAVAFRRLIVQRRHRLRAFLADPRRRIT